MNNNSKITHKEILFILILLNCILVSYKCIAYEEPPEQILRFKEALNQGVQIALNSNIPESVKKRLTFSLSEINKGMVVFTYDKNFQLQYNSRKCAYWQSNPNWQIDPITLENKFYCALTTSDDTDSKSYINGLQCRKDLNYIINNLNWTPGLIGLNQFCASYSNEYLKILSVHEILGFLDSTYALTLKIFNSDIDLKIPQIPDVDLQNLKVKNANLLISCCGSIVVGNGGDLDDYLFKKSGLIYLAKISKKYNSVNNNSIPFSLIYQALLSLKTEPAIILPNRGIRIDQVDNSLLSDQTLIYVAPKFYIQNEHFRQKNGLETIEDTGPVALGAAKLQVLFAPNEINIVDLELINQTKKSRLISSNSGENNGHEIFKGGVTFSPFISSHYQIYTLPNFDYKFIWINSNYWNSLNLKAQNQFLLNIDSELSLKLKSNTFYPTEDLGTSWGASQMEMSAYIPLSKFKAFIKNIVKN